MKKAALFFITALLFTGISFSQNDGIELLANGDFEIPKTGNPEIGNHVGVIPEPWEFLGAQPNIISVDGTNAYGTGGNQNDANPLTINFEKQQYLDLYFSESPFYQSFEIDVRSTLEYSGYFGSRRNVVTGQVGTISIRRGDTYDSSILIDEVSISIEGNRSATDPWTVANGNIEVGAGTYYYVVKMRDQMNFDLASVIAKEVIEEEEEVPVIIPVDSTNVGAALKQALLAATELIVDLKIKQVELDMKLKRLDERTKVLVVDPVLADIEITNTNRFYTFGRDSLYELDRNIAFGNGCDELPTKIYAPNGFELDGNILELNNATLTVAKGLFNKGVKIDVIQALAQKLIVLKCTGSQVIITAD